MSDLSEFLRWQVTRRIDDRLANAGKGVSKKDITKNKIITLLKSFGRLERCEISDELDMSISNTDRALKELMDEDKCNRVLMDKTKIGGKTNPYVYEIIERNV